MSTEAIAAWVVAAIVAAYLWLNGGEPIVPATLAWLAVYIVIWQVRFRRSRPRRQK